MEQILLEPGGISIEAILDSLQAIYPELALTVGLLLVIFWDLVSNLDRKQDCAYITIFTLLVGLVMVIADFNQIEAGVQIPIFGGTIVLDRFALFMKTVFFLAALLVTLFSLRQSEVPFLGQGEYYSLILSITLAASLLSAAQNVIVIILSFEFLSLPQYILSGSMKSERDSVEASLKYVIYGGVASGAMIFGFSLLYGFTGGHLDIGAIQTYFIENASTFAAGDQIALATILILIMAGIGFKISAVPFHMWSPDVYQGAPTPAVALFSIGPKAAGFAFLIRLFFGGFSSGLASGNEMVAVTQLDWPLLLSVISVISMTVGNLAAIWQNNIKRLLAYSSIAHAGYLMIGIVALTHRGLESVLFYIFIYLIMNLGIFVSVITLIDATGEEEISSYSGLGWKLPAVGIPMGVFLFSLTGLPPTAGFTAKFFLFYSAEQAGLRWLVVVALLNTVVSLYYYVKIIKTLYLEQPDEDELIEVDESKVLPTYRFLSVVLLIATIGFFLFPDPVKEFASKAAESII